jgi:DNA ligase-1
MNDFKPMLAATAEDLSALTFPLLASPKLDGIRCVKHDGKALSRSLKPIPNKFVREWVEQHLPDGIDGELMLADHKAPFRDVTSAIMSHEGEPDFRFQAFDLWRYAAPRFDVRYELLNIWFDQDCGQGVGTRCAIVPHTQCDNLMELNDIIMRNKHLGYEGTMVRSPGGPYKFGRSTAKEGYLLKIKDFLDEEAVVIGIVEEMHNANAAYTDEVGRTKRSRAKAGKVGKGTMGALVCKLPDGTTFEVGSGFTEKERQEIWDLFCGATAEMLRAANPAAGPISIFLGEGAGKVIPPVKFKHLPPPGGRPAGVKPRHPVFLGFRWD